MYLSYELYVNYCILVFYIKDILPEAKKEDLDLVLNICKRKIQEFESSGVLSQLSKVRENNYSNRKINQSIYLVLNILKEKYPEYKEAISRLCLLMKKIIILEKKENLKR